MRKVFGATNPETTQFQLAVSNGLFFIPKYRLNTSSIPTSLTRTINLGTLTLPQIILKNEFKDVCLAFSITVDKKIVFAYQLFETDIVPETRSTTDSRVGVYITNLDSFWRYSTETLQDRLGINFTDWDSRTYDFSNTSERDLRLVLDTAIGSYKWGLQWIDINGGSDCTDGYFGIGYGGGGRLTFRWRHAKKGENDFEWYWSTYNDYSLIYKNRCHLARYLETGDIRNGYGRRWFDLDTVGIKMEDIIGKGNKNILLRDGDQTMTFVKSGKNIKLKDAVLGWDSRRCILGYGTSNNSCATETHGTYNEGFIIQPGLKFILLKLLEDPGTKLNLNLCKLYKGEDIFNTTKYKYTNAVLSTLINFDECSTVFNNFCSAFTNNKSNLFDSVCIDYCRDNNCADIVNQYCQSQDEPLNDSNRKICGCATGAANVNQAWFDFKDSFTRKGFQIPTCDLEYQFPACDASSYKFREGVTNGVKQPCNSQILNCISTINLDNKGKIVGDVTVVSNPNCSQFCKGGSCSGGGGDTGGGGGGGDTGGGGGGGGDTGGDTGGGTITPITQQSFFERYKYYIITGISILLVLLIVLVVIMTR